MSIKGGIFDSDLAALGRRLIDTIFVLGGTDWVFCWLVFTNIDGFVFVSVLVLYIAKRTTMLMIKFNDNEI